MERSFEYSLRPKSTTSSTKPASENLWSLSEATKLAQKGVKHIQVDLERPAELFIDGSIKLFDVDFQRIIDEIGRNKTGEPETRSVNFDLIHPIAVKGKRPCRITSVQIKGIVFDSREAVAIYGGAGWPREYFFGGRNGIVRRYEAAKENAIGYCFLQEAVSEFLMCRELRKRLTSTETEVPYPVGWGKFEKTDDRGSQFGFVILGHPELVPNREQVYLEATDELSRTGNFDKVGHLLALRAQSMREVNQAGVTVHGRHFGNFSLTASGKSYMHDLGNPTSLVRENMYGDEQFLAETFAELAYALTPRKIVVPVPGLEGPYRDTVVRHLDKYTETFLKSYYQDSAIGKSVKFEDFEEAFFAALHKPLLELDLAAAVLHCKVVGKWLENYHHSKPTLKTKEKVPATQ